VTPTPRENRRLTKKKPAWARESLYPKCWPEVRAGVNQYSSHLTTLEGWKRWPSSSIGADEGWVLQLGVRPCTSSVLGTAKYTPMSPHLVDRVEKGLCSRRMLPLGEGEATMIAIWAR